MANDEARLDVMSHLAESLFYFFLEEGMSEDERERTLTDSQMIAFHIINSMGLEVTSANGKQIVCSLDLKEPFAFLNEALSISGNEALDRGASGGDYR